LRRDCAASPYPVRNLKFVLTTRAYMKSVNELLELFMRQAQLERAMRQPGGARVIDARELEAVKQKLAAVPEAVKREAAAARP